MATPSTIPCDICSKPSSWGRAGNSMCLFRCSEHEDHRSDEKLLADTAIIKNEQLPKCYLNTCKNKVPNQDEGFPLNLYCQEHRDLMKSNQSFASSQNIYDAIAPIQVHNSDADTVELTPQPTTDCPYGVACCTPFLRCGECQPYSLCLRRSQSVTSRSFCVLPFDHARGARPQPCFLAPTLPPLE